MDYKNYYDYHENELMQESMIDDVLKSASNYKKELDKAENLYDKMDITNDKLGKLKNDTETIDKTLQKHRVDTRSIVARARNSVLQFPIYVTQTLRVNEAQIIAGLFERVYTTLVQTVLSHNQILNEEEANNLVFLKKFHSNLKEAADVIVNKYYEPIDDIDKMIYESIFYSQRLTENCTVDFSVIPCTDTNLILENSRLLNDPLTGFIYLTESDNNNLNDFEKKEEISSKYVTLNEDDLKEMAKERADISDSEWKIINMSNKEIEEELLRASNKNKIDKSLRQAIDRKIDQKHKSEDKFKKSIDELKKDIKDGKINGYSYDGVRYRRKENMGKTTITKRKKEDEKAIDAPKILRDSDIKKINGMLPYTIEATFRIRTSHGIDRDIKYIIGIKSVMHLIRAQDLVEDINELVTGNIKSLQKVRYKTGEIKFADYFFNIKNIKADAAKHINYNKRWINTLKRLAEYGKTNRSLMKKPIELITGGGVPIPNGTLILSQPDVTMITNQSGIDLSKVSNAKRLARSLFLIAVVIVDSSAGTMRVLFPDSDNDWDVQSLSAIDAELAKTDNSQLMKELNRMVNR